MSGNYRVELSVSGRAVCQSTECKKAGTKIAKDVLRFGVWVEYDERGSWKWRHWGCVTGKVIQNIRDALDDGNSGYRWDCLDGYDGDEKGSLHKSPELQAKVRRCITQGFIDPEDFNGDPEMNKLGETGMRTKESKKKMAEEEKARNFQEKLDKLKGQLEDASGQNATELEQQIKEIESKLEKMANPSPTQAPKSGPAKRKANADEGDDGEQTKPAKKKRASKPKKEEDVGDEESISAPAKKPRAKKVKKEVEDDNEMTKEEAKPAPAKKSGAKIAKKEDLDDDEDSKPTLTKRAPAKKMKEEEDDDDDAEKVQAPKKRAPRGKKVKEEIEAESDAGEVSAPKKRAPRKKKDPAEEGQSAPSKRAPAEKGGNTAKKETNNATPSLTDGSSLEDIEVTPATKDESTKPAKLPVDPPARMSDTEAINAEHAQDAVVEVTADFPAAGSKPKSKKGRAKSDLKAATSTRGSRSQATSAL